LGIFLEDIVFWFFSKQWCLTHARVCPKHLLGKTKKIIPISHAYLAWLNDG
jgi:hypothetical protein